MATANSTRNTRSNDSSNHTLKVANLDNSGFAPMTEGDAKEYFSIARDKFGELAAIFDILACRTDEHDDLHKLARLGKGVAQDYENLAACWQDEVNKGGLRP